MRTRLALLGLLLAVLAAPALAATRNGITPRAPKAGGTVKAGEPVTFRGRARGKGPVWIYVCRSKKRDSQGLICARELNQRARRLRRGRFQAKARFYDYPSFWLNNPGTYYWQAHRIHCPRPRDCVQDGPVVRFKVG